MMTPELPDQDELIMAESADIQRDMRERAKNDLFFFAKAVLGYNDITVSCHKPLCVFLDQHPSRFKLTMMPRGHFKTSLATISRVMQKVCRNQNERILLANETSTNAQRFLNAIKQHAESNRRFRALFGYLIPKKPKRWSNDELEFVRTWYGPEPTIDTIGMTGAATSRHFTHITVDDPISEEAAKSEAVMQDTITRIDKIISLMVNPEINTFDLTGTRWAYHDVYSHFMRSYGTKLARFIRPAIVNGVPIFPEFFSLETLAQTRKMMGEYAFSCLYMNNPRDEEAQDFNVQDLRFWEWSRDESAVVLFDVNGDILKEVAFEKLDITVAVDLAMAEKITSDCNAVVTCGTTPDGELLVLDTWNKRCTPLEVIEHLFWVKQRYRPRVVGIESVAYQKAFSYFLKAEAERRGEYLNIEPLKAIPSKRGTGNNSKETRIRGLQPIAATSRLFIRATQHELRNQLSDFPLGEHDDIIDALAHNLALVRGYVSPSRMEKYRQAEQRVINAALGRGVDPRELLPYPGRKAQDIPHPDDLGIEVPRFGPSFESTLP